MGVTAAIIGGAAALGAAGIASSGAKKAASQQAAAQQQALTAQQQAAAAEQQKRQEAFDLQQEAIKANPYPTYLSTAPAQEYQKTLQERMAGRGLIDVNALTSPIAAQEREGLKRTNALTAAAASARGLGRSSVVTSQFGANSLAAEQDIASRMAQLEIARQEQIGQAVGAYGDLSRVEAQSQANKADYNVGNVKSQANTLIGAAAANTANQLDISTMIAQQGKDAASYQLLQAGIWGSALQGISQSATKTATELIDALKAPKTTSTGPIVNRTVRSAEALNPDIYSRGGF